MLNIEEIFTVKNIVIYLISINIVTFLAMFIDKKRAEKGEWRIKESTLLGLAMLGGSIGGITGMYVFRHNKKTKILSGISCNINNRNCTGNLFCD
jgi:uncharacterized membrane protein YsdA (DUF1294 family)